MEMIRRIRFTCIGKGHGAPCLPATKEDWENLRRESWLAQMCAMCARIEKGDDELKHRLPVWTPHCAEFKDNHRAIADAVKPLNRLMLDFDEKGHTDEIVARLLEKSPLVPLLIEESVRRGTHVLVELPDGMSPEQAQELMQEATGFTPDAAVKDVSRCIYMVPEDHTKYVSPKLFEATDYRTDRTEPSPENCNLGTVPSMMFKGIPYTSIISEWWRRNGGEPAEGERNVKLHKLAVNLRSICDNKKEVLMAVMPRFGLSDVELRSIVDSACKEEPKGISKVMQQIVEDLLLSPKLGDDRGLNEGIDDDGSDPQPPNLGGLCKHLPIGLRESLVGVPVSMHMPVLCGIMPICAAYADQVEVEYCDGNTHHLALARKREEEWKERKKGRKANEKAPEDPHVLIRLVPVTVSCSTLLKRFKNATGHTLYSFGEELDTLRKTNGAGEWGQDYNSDSAESGVVNVAYNWTMLGTNGALRKCFKQDNIENGLSSRILVAEMPDSSFSKMPKFGKRSAEDEARIQEAVTRLRSFTGLVDVPRLRKAIEAWVEEKRAEEGY